MGQRDRVVVVLWMVMLWQMGRCAERQEPLGCWAVRSFNFRQASTRTRFDISLGRYLKPVSWRSVAVHQGAPEPVVVGAYNICADASYTGSRCHRSWAGRSEWPVWSSRNGTYLLLEYSEPWTARCAQPAQPSVTKL